MGLVCYLFGAYVVIVGATSIIWVALSAGGFCVAFSLWVVSIVVLGFRFGGLE